jgi:hypothetical protein
MLFLMFRKLSLLLKVLGTDLAFEGLLARVNSNVIFQITFLVKLFATDAANENRVQSEGLLIDDLSTIADNIVDLNFSYL